MKNKLRGFTLIEVLVVVSIIAALAAVVMTISKSSKAKAQQVVTLQKMKALGTAFAAYTTDKNGLMPLESAIGSDDWTDAGKPENQEVWYNALPSLMNAPAVGAIGSTDPARFYQDAYPLFIAGAPYPSAEKRVNKPLFAVGMNSRLQRKSDSGVVSQSRLAQILNPAKTVVFLERGLPNDKKTAAGQAGFNGSPKANARAFAARHNQKGCLVFADGHSEVRAASELLTKGGGIITPQTSIVWTLNPDSDPN
jgi:prepilin-type N-terminal cleavage/methylation domain-containing protein